MLRQEADRRTAKSVVGYEAETVGDGERTPRAKGVFTLTRIKSLSTAGDPGSRNGEAVRYLVALAPAPRWHNIALEILAAIYYI
jgi:hypothetical protein